MNDRRIMECVPNFSEGRDITVINRITEAIGSVEGVQLLHVDRGEGANRTVVTFAGEPEGVVEAAFRGAVKAAELIDMRCHHGTHPRIGATDVLPLVPVSGITLDECALMARRLAERMAVQAAIPCYCYEAAAFKPERRNLAVCRAGEYEGLERKLANAALWPDFIPPEMTDSIAAGIMPEGMLRTGCSVVGAREFLIAVNFNLNTPSVPVAKEIACDVRTKGRPMQPGTLKAAKAIGWYIDEYGIAQVSMNLTNLGLTPLHEAYEEVCRCAKARGVQVTGTEIIGLVPKKALTDAGRYFLQKQGKTEDVSEEYAVKTAIEHMALDDLRPFNPREKVIEYLLKE